MASSFSYCYSHPKIRLVPLDVVRTCLMLLLGPRRRIIHRVDVERVSWYSARTVLQAPCQISLGLVSSSAPGAPSSRPYPEALKPPNGARGSERVKSLINTIPDSISPATRRARTRSRLQTAALRPKSVILARRIASSSVLKGKIIATGPKNSSLAIAASGGSPTSTVGG